MKSYNISKIKSIKKITKSDNCYDLTIENFSRYFANDILVHNTDGIQISITVKNNEIRAARNKSHIKNSGEDSLTADALQQLFVGRGEIEIAFVNAVKDLSNSILKLSEKDKTAFFAEGKKFASVEIISPATQNTVPYGLNMLIFHGIIEYDTAGNPISEDKQAGRDIGKLIEKANLASQKTFYVRGPQDISLLPLPNNVIRETYYLSALKKITQDFGLNDLSTVGDYSLAVAKKYFLEILNSENQSIPEELIIPLAKRLCGIDKSFNVHAIKRELNTETYAWYMAYEKSQEKSFRKKVFAPLESIFLELGTEIMKNLSSFLSANPTAAAESMKAEINNVIKTIKSNGGEDDIRKMEYELERVSSAGGIESIVPTEGITFIYKDKLYKFTGIFAALHQIRSIIAYKK